MKTLTSSVLVAQALGFRQDGVRSKRAGLCAYCGLSIQEGDLCIPFSAGQAFMDDLSLAAKGSGLTCGYCATLLTVDGLRMSGYGMFYKGGVIPFRKWKDIAEGIRNPPEPPFVAVYATANNQHMAWRAPVNLSRDLFYVRVGLRDLKIRRQKLLEAVEGCQRLADIMGIPATQKSVAHPFASLSTNLKDAHHGQIRRNHFHEAAIALPDDAERLFDLTLGETWALRFLLSPNAGTKEDE